MTGRRPSAGMKRLERPARLVYNLTDASAAGRTAAMQPFQTMESQVTKR